MIFKVFHQDSPDEVPVRERTNSLFIEAASIPEVRRKLEDRSCNIEYIHALGEAHLAYEQKSEDFVVENA